MFGLGLLYYVTILLLNAVAILNEDRFLARLGWGASSDSQAFGAPASEETFKGKLVNLIKATRTVMRPFNISVIIYELILG